MISPSQQIPLDLQHRPAHGREDFMIAPCNEQAVSWIDRWPEWPAPALILYGPPACGKSHLTSVWASKTNAHKVTAEELNGLDADALAAKAECLVVDSIDPWIGEREVETTLFHLYNIMKEHQRTMLLTMRMAPTHIDFTIPDLASRLRAAPAACIDTPDDTLLSVLLVKMFSDRQLQISTDVLKYILPRMERSFDAARHLVDEADKRALSEKKGISIPLIRSILLDEQQYPLFSD